MQPESTNKQQQQGLSGGLIAAASDRRDTAPNSNSLVGGGLELQSFGIKGNPTQLKRSSAAAIPSEEVIVRGAYLEDNLIVIKWDSEATNILGFRVVYRLFGKGEFKEGPQLQPTEREFRIKNVPANVCLSFRI